MTVPEPTAECEACPSGLEYATEDQLRGVIERHHALRTAKDAEIAALRAENERLGAAMKPHNHHIHYYGGPGSDQFEHGCCRVCGGLGDG